MVFFHKPENAIKRAEELIAVQQQGAALELLHEQIMSKRSRTTPLPILQEATIKFIGLCVDLRKGKVAKEGLYQFKNIAQSTNVVAVEQVIKIFIEKADAKVTAAQSQAELLNLDGVEDLEESETPESILMGYMAVGGAASKEKHDRHLVMPWLRFLWEAYRTALDIVRNNVRLETLYQTVANHAFNFCLKYQRKNEFRRLCEMLRQHIATAARFSRQQNAINMDDPDTLQRLLDTRFVQLHVATELELWQEAFRSVEDIQNLFELTNMPPKAFMLANYYDKLSKIFLVGDNPLFHAAAMNKFYNIIRQNKNVTAEDHQRFTSQVVIAALAIPSSATNKSKNVGEYMDDSKQKNHRLTALLRVQKSPNRETLLKEALEKRIFHKASADVQELFTVLETKFHPLSICKKVAPILARMSESKHLARYIKPLHNVILTRLFQQLSQVYTTVKLDFVLKLVSNLDDKKYNAFTIQRFIVNACQSGEFTMSIDHKTNTINFNSQLFKTNVGGSLSQNSKSTITPSEQMRTQFARFAKRLQTVCAVIGPFVDQEAKKRAIKIAMENAELEHSQALQRGNIIEKKKELRENELQRKDQQAARQKQLNIEKEREAERKRIEEETKRREEERIQQQNLEIERQEARKLAEKIIEDMKGKNVKLSMDELQNLTTAELRILHLKALEKDKQEMDNKLHNLVKQQDFSERAYRHEELVLLKETKRKQKEEDREKYEEIKKKTVDDAKARHEQNMELKKRFSRIVNDYNNFFAPILKAAEAEHVKLQEEANKKLEAEKTKRIEAWELEQEEERKREVKAEEERKRRQEAEDNKRDEIRRLEEERLARDAKRRAEEEEKRKKLDEIVQKQQNREREIEERIQRGPATSNAPAPGTVWKRGDNNTAAAPSFTNEPEFWRRGESARPAARVDEGDLRNGVENSSRPAAKTEEGSWRKVGNRNNQEQKKYERPRGERW